MALYLNIPKEAFFLLIFTVLSAWLGMYAYRHPAKRKPSRKHVLALAAFGLLNLAFFPFWFMTLGTLFFPVSEAAYLAVLLVLMFVPAASLGYSLSTRTEDLLVSRWPSLGPIAAFIGLAPAALFPAEIVWVWLGLLTGFPL